MLPAGSEELVQVKYIRPDCRVLVLPAGSEELVQGKYIRPDCRVLMLPAGSEELVQVNIFDQTSNSATCGE